MASERNGATYMEGDTSVPTNITSDRRKPSHSRSLTDYDYKPRVMTQREGLFMFERNHIRALQEERLALQKKTFTKWINAHLLKAQMVVEDLFTDLTDGIKLLKLLEIISGEKPGEPNNGKTRVHKLDNVNKSLAFLQTKVRLESIGAQDIVNGNSRLTLGLIWTIIRHFQIKEIEIDVDEKSESRGKKSAKDALLVWCQRKTDGYPGVNIQDFTGSWRNGLGFNALIHAHFPDLIDFKALQPSRHIENLNNAFDVANNELGIPRLLDAEDVDQAQPDEKSVIMYVASYYHTFDKMKNEIEDARHIANENKMEEIRTEDSQQASNLVYPSTKQVDLLSDGDMADGNRCSLGQTDDIFSFDIVNTCNTVKDEKEEEGDPFCPTGSETMEEPKILKPSEIRVSDLIGSIGDSLPYTNDHRIVSSPEKIIGAQGPDSPVFFGYGSVDSSTPKSSVSLDLNANPSSPMKLLKMPHVDVTDASPISQDNDMSSSEHYEAVTPVEKYAQEYSMNHNRRGIAVIFNHDKFKNMSPRPGSAVDVCVLEETYDALGFEVIVCDNLKFADIQSVITELSEEDHSDADCLLVTVLTHGETSKFLYAEDSVYNVEDLWLPFTSDKCQSLAGKPKIFIIQACHGERLDPEVTLKQGTEGCMETESMEAAYKIPTQADFLIAYSSVEGYNSWRSPDTGTWFIQCLCKELQEHASTKDFLKILTGTSLRMTIDHEPHNDLIAWQHQQKQEYRMEEIRGEGSQQLSNLLYLSTEQVKQLSKGDKTNRTRCSFGHITGILSLDLVSICATLKYAEEEEGDPFTPTVSETMEVPKNQEPGERRVSDVIDSIGDSVPYTNDDRIVSSPEKIIDIQGPDSPVSSEYDNVDSGTPKSSVSPDSNANPSSPKMLLKMPQVDVTDACPASQDNDMSCSETYEAVMPVEKDAEDYNMNHNRRGKAVIFNHDVFKDQSLHRAGSAVDVCILTETYGALGFEVVVHQNLKFTDIEIAITELAKEDHSDADCLLVTVLTHGQMSKFLYAQDSLYSVDDLWSPFTADKCQSLAGKPKIFIIQACRGDKLDAGVTLKRRTETDSMEASYKIPTQADFLIAYSSVAGHYSWRNPDTGTWFIQCLCKELKEHASTKDFLKILTRTSRRVAIDCESYNDKIPQHHQQKQVPSFNSMLIRDLYFSSKIRKTD